MVWGIRTESGVKSPEIPLCSRSGYGAAYVIDGGWGGTDARNRAAAGRRPGGQGLSGGRRLRAPRPGRRPAHGAVRHGHGERRGTRRPPGTAGRPHPPARGGGLPGPLTVFVTGQLHLDRRQHLPHLALARTTPSTVRYTGFPWHWFREELRLRAPGSTSLFLDVHADTETWEWLGAHPLDSGRNTAVYGRIAPPPSRRTVAGPAYMKAVATLLRSGHRPPLDQLHQQALTRISAEGGVGTDIVLTAYAPAQIPPRLLPRPRAPSRPRSPPRARPPPRPDFRTWLRAEPVPAPGPPPGPEFAAAPRGEPGVRFPAASGAEPGSGRSAAPGAGRVVGFGAASGGEPGCGFPAPCAAALGTGPRAELPADSAAALSVGSGTEFGAGSCTEFCAKFCTEFCAEL